MVLRNKTSLFLVVTGFSMSACLSGVDGGETNISQSYKRRDFTTFSDVRRTQPSGVNLDANVEEIMANLKNYTAVNEHFVATQLLGEDHPTLTQMNDVKQSLMAEIEKINQDDDLKAKAKDFAETQRGMTDQTEQDQFAEAIGAEGPTFFVTYQKAYIFLGQVFPTTTDDSKHVYASKVANRENPVQHWATQMVAYKFANEVRGLTPSSSHYFADLHIIGQGASSDIYLAAYTDVYLFAHEERQFNNESQLSAFSKDMAKKGIASVVTYQQAYEFAAQTRNLADDKDRHEFAMSMAEADRNYYNEYVKGYTYAQNDRGINNDNEAHQIAEVLGSINSQKD